ncbi:MAG TPA: 23S rRNA (pseudouridine(1915)-N(3))-methyltransferase RlmH [Steroidobacteraceae bacterium]|nr:23S rRNA (pseudouridine(1915)-N(3))-methyltransferase RlmH [Steroidobacteraceae bacterium]
MRLRVLAVGTRMPGWVAAACEEYRRRLRAPWRLTLTEVAPAARGAGGGAAARARALEARAILGLLGERDYVVALDERGSEWSTRELADWLAGLRGRGEPLVFIIGGADGIDAALLDRARLRWSLSRLTLPHALARVLLFEQLYRAASLLAGHPYHRA